MASPQIEDGFTSIANEILEALCKMNLSPYEGRILFCVIRKTYGWRKKTDWISLSQFSKECMLDRRHAYRAIKGLFSKNILVICRDDKKHPTYGFQKDYKRWVSSVEMTTFTEKMRERRERKVPLEMTRIVPVEAPTKETLTKETLTKETLKEREERDLRSPPEIPSSKKERQKTSFAGISYLLSNPNAFKGRLKDLGYRPSESQLKSIQDRILQLVDEKNDISDQDIECIVQLVARP